MIDGSPAAREISLTVRRLALRFVFVTQQQRLNCVDVFISTQSHTASAAAHTPVDCSELHQQPVDAFLHPTFIQILCYNFRAL